MGSSPKETNQVDKKIRERAGHHEGGSGLTCLWTPQKHKWKYAREREGKWSSMREVVTVMRWCKAYESLFGGSWWVAKGGRWVSVFFYIYIFDVYFIRRIYVFNKLYGLYMTSVGPFYAATCIVFSSCLSLDGCLLLVLLWPKSAAA